VTLSPGTRLGPYEIASPLGAGEMGTLQVRGFGGSTTTYEEGA